MKKWILNSILITALATTAVANVPMAVSNIQTQQTNSHANERSSFDLMGAEATYDKAYSETSTPEEGIKIKLYVDGVVSSANYEILDGTTSVKTGILPAANNGVIVLETTNELSFNTQYTVKVTYGEDRVQTATVLTTSSPQVFTLNTNISDTFWTTDSVKVEYSWTQANELAFENTKLKFEILDGSTVVNEKENIATDGGYGNGTYEYVGLVSEHEYTLNAYSNNNADKTYTLKETATFTTNSPDDTYSSDIEFNQASFNSVDGVYSWKLNTGIEATSVDLSIFDKDDKQVSNSVTISTAGKKEGYEELEFNNLFYGEEYKVVETVTKDGAEESQYSYRIKTLDKTIPVKTMFNPINTKEAFEGTYTWHNNLSEEQYIKVESTEVEVTNTTTGDSQTFKGIENESLEGQVDIKLDNVIAGNN